MKFTVTPALFTFTLASTALAQATATVAPSAHAPDGAMLEPAPTTETIPPPVVAPSAELHYETDGATLFLLRDQVRVPVSVPGPVKTATYHDGSLYVTHGTTLVSVYTCQDPEHPVLLRSLTTGRGVATGVEVVGGKVWIISVSQQAVPADELATGLATGDNAGAPQNNATPGTTPTAAAAPALGHAVKVVEPGTVEVAAGRNASVRVGDRFAIYRETSVSNGDGAFSGEELVAFAEVVAVKDDSALAELSRTAVVKESDVARVARPDQSESNAYPVRVAHVGEFGGTIRPLINAGSPLGVGVLADVQASYWGNGYFVNLMVQPLGLGWTDAGNVVSTSALLEGGYDGRAFSVGLGVGVSAVNGDVESMLASSRGFGAASLDENSTQVTERQATHSAFALSQVVRLGARDGVNLALRNLLILQEGSDENDSGFIYGGTMSKLTVPLDRRNDLFLEGGGGVMGYWLIGAGVGTWVVGNGSPGSWKLSISAGAAGIWGTKQVTTTTANSSWTSDESVELAGPMVAFGLTRRFGL